MSARLKIINSILFGDLRPNNNQTENDEFFRHFLLPHFVNPEGSINQFKHHLNSILKELNPNSNLIIEIFEYNDNKYLELSNPHIFQEPFIKFLSPGFSNNKQQFYFYLIKHLSYILVHDLIYEVLTCSTSSSKKHAIHMTLREIKFLVTEVNKQIINQKQSEVIENQQSVNCCKSTYYILNVLYCFLIKLYIEVYLIFPEHTSDEKVELKPFFESKLNIQFPVNPFNLNYSKLFSFLLKKFIIHHEYKIEVAIFHINKCIEELKIVDALNISHIEREEYKAELKIIIETAENLIFTKELNNSDYKPDYENLINSEFNDNVYSFCTNSYFTLINDVFNPVQKLDIVINLTNKLKSNFSKINIPASIEINSIPRKILNWLKHQEEFYKANQHIDFEKLKKADLPKIPTDLNVGELALIFRLFVEEKIMLPKSKTDLFKVISAIFQSKKTTDLSQNSIKNKFDSPETNAFDFWDTKLVDLRRQNQKLKVK